MTRTPHPLVPSVETALFLGDEWRKVPRSARAARHEPSTEVGSLDVRFRSTMADVCTPVSVVTALDNGKAHGTTVSAFASLSIDPPMVLVSLNRQSQLLGIIDLTRRMGINILALDQRDLALRFAKKGEDKFAELGWSVSAEVPRLRDTAGWVACEVVDLVPGGDHLIVLGRVVEVGASSCLPLTYHRRTFGTHVAQH